ncbi:ABC transporter permease [Vreelandella maris]|uniref:ABC transporter permease n=1 Tax=Vreelandella maris TaxID=2729617 RepID=UPI0030EC1868
MIKALPTVLATLFAHYRRHPGQLAMLLLGLWVASALWSGIQAINATARDSYDRADAMFDTQLDQLERRDGAPLTRADYHALRQAGLPVSPMLEGEVVTQDGTRLTLIGIDPLTLANNNPLAQADSSGSLTDFLTPPWQTRAAPDTLTATTTLANGKTLPPIVSAPVLPPDTLMMDIAAAARLLESGEEITRLVAAPGALGEAPVGLTLTRATRIATPGQLTESFHLNLTALGLLAWVVGLFIVQAALGLALEQRLGMLRTLRVLGVSGRSLVLALGVELILLGLIGAAAGIASGVWLARLLLPDVAATLGSLYGAGVGRELNLPWHYWVGGLAVSLGGLLLAGARCTLKHAGIRPDAGLAKWLPSTVNVDEYRRRFRSGRCASFVYLASLSAPRRWLSGRLCAGCRVTSGQRTVAPPLASPRIESADTSRPTTPASSLGTGGYAASATQALARHDGPTHRPGDQSRGRQYGRWFSSHLFRVAGSALGRPPLFECSRRAIY